MFSESFIVCPDCGYYFDDRHLDICRQSTSRHKAGLRCPRCSGRITVKMTDGQHITITFCRAQA